jgi:hypothetical protein
MKSDDLIQSIKTDPPVNEEERNRYIMLLAQSYPVNGINPWLFKIARFMHRGPLLVIPKDIYLAIRRSSRNSRRPIDHAETFRAINNSNPDLNQEQKNGQQYHQPRGKERNGEAKKSNLSAIARIHSESIHDLNRVSQMSPVKSPTRAIAFEAMYPEPNLLLCFCRDPEKPGGIAMNWRKGRLPYPPLYIPNPLLGRWAKIKEGRWSERALENVGPRRFGLETNKRNLYGI